MPAERVLAARQAKDAANQLLALTGPMKQQIGRVLEHGGILADPQQWDCELAGRWRHDWGPGANHLRQTAAKLDELGHRAQQVIENIFKADGAALSDGAAPSDIGTIFFDHATIPAVDTNPVEVNAWWQGLDRAQQQGLVSEFPAQIGRLDGLPAVVRDQANRAVLATGRQQLQDQLAGLEAHPPPETVRGFNINPYTDALGEIITNPAWLQWQQQVAQIQEKLAGIEAIDQRLNHAKPGQQPAFLLGFDSSGSGRAIVSMGNPDTATNVATYVPGTGARLGHVNTDIHRSDSMVQAARIAGSPSTAVITWIGYDAPQQIFPDAAEDRWADGAKQDLDRFQDGLRVSHVGARAHNTVIGHSYGTTVIGHAARDGNLNADDVVFVASPGVGVTHADQLHLDGIPSNQVGQHVYCTVAQYDPIQLAAGINGADPTGLSFGGTTFESKSGEAGPWYALGWNGAVHSQY